MVAFDSSGNIKWIVPDYYPAMATADGSIIAWDGTQFDSNGNATGQIGSFPTQSWTGNAYVQPLGSIEQVIAPVLDVDGASFLPQVGGNPSGNGTAILQCPCLLQSASTTESVLQSASLMGTAVSSTGSQKTHLIVVGDPGLNEGPGREHNVGPLFDLAGETQAQNLTSSGNNMVITKRVSTIWNLSLALITNGPIDGTVTYFGHAGLDFRGNLALFPGELRGDAYNVSVLNVNELSNSQLGPDVTITLNACHAGVGGKNSIAQLIANQLKRTVFAYPVGMYFSSSPTPRHFDAETMHAPTGVPTYMVPNGDGIQPTRFKPL